MEALHHIKFVHKIQHITNHLAFIVCLRSTFVSLTSSLQLLTNHSLFNIRGGVAQWTARLKVISRQFELHYFLNQEKCTLIVNVWLVHRNRFDRYFTIGTKVYLELYGRLTLMVHMCLYISRLYQV